MTATTQPSGGLGLEGPDPPAEGRDLLTRARAPPGIDVPLGRRVMVVSDLLLTPEATPSTTAVIAELARALDTWDGPGILIIAGNLFDLTGCRAAAGVPPVPGGPPGTGAALTRFLTVDERRVIRQTGTHEPGYDTDPRPSPPGRPGRRAARAGGPAPPDRHRRPGGAGGAGRARLRRQGAADPRRSSTRPSTPSPASSASPRPAGDGGRWPPSPPTMPPGWRAQPAQRPLGPFPLRGLPHPLPPAGALRLVAAGSLRRGRTAAGGRDPVGARPPRVGAHRPGPSATPTRPTWATRSSSPVGGPGRAGGAGRGPRPAEPTDVVDPGRRRPRTGCSPRPEPTTPPETRAAGWSVGATPV